MENINWAEMVSTIFQAVIIPLLTVATGYLVSFIKKKSKALQDATQAEMLDKYITIAEKYLVDCVTSTNQIFVDVLKRDNRFDEEAQRQAFEMTKSTFLDGLDKTAKEFLETAMSDFNLWIDTLIESNVKQTKGW